jgi:dipeptidyl aminopeptidase/acylaminoacyl peptidase
LRITGITYVPRKTHRLRNILTILLILVLLVVLAVIAISGYYGWKLIHPEKVGIEPFSANIVPEYRSVDFSAKDETLILNGWFFEVKGSDKTIILAHSYGKNRLQFDESTVDIIKGLVSKGYNVLAFDLRNSGKSEGKLSTMGLYEKNDLLGAINYAKSQGSKHIVLMGFSTGASASILAAAESRDVDAVIADSPYSELGSYLENNMPVWTKLPDIPFTKTITYSLKLLGGIDIDKAIPRRAIINISPGSIMLIHGSDDKIIPPEHSRILYSIFSKTNSKNHELWETKDAGHLESYTRNPQEYMRRILDFLEKVYEK